MGSRASFISVCFVLLRNNDVPQLTLGTALSTGVRDATMQFGCSVSQFSCSVSSKPTSLTAWHAVTAAAYCPIYLVTAPFTSLMHHLPSYCTIHRSVVPHQVGIPDGLRLDEAVLQIRVNGARCSRRQASLADGPGLSREFRGRSG